MLLSCPKQNVNQSSEKLKVIYIKHFLFYVSMNYQFKTREMKNEGKLVEKTVQALKSW